ncbi:MAG: FtsX-like permease family protein [Candidatus Omnitrophica bacterium]|nr:FtsX-like permease family protein [Candidatus Omnitrophota bacterium]MCM8810002.1 FtsX-like permease family protein [Candidatus Omnitrophota bacterium]MCM8810617.1 FtsX-like permease family protein [Candidatus Omnitrophota bacterium]
MEKKIEKQLSLPLKNALQMSLRNFKIRFGRAIIVTMSILLGIAFFMSIMASNVFTMALIEKGPENIRSVLIENLPEIKVRQTWLVSLSLLVCTVGIINSMLMAVTERSREIGTMKCLGALDRFVMELFLLEAMIHGIGGSIIGSFLGILIMTLVYIAQYKKIILSIFPTLTLLKFVGISIILGTGLAIIGALYPAIVSARMEPAEAIRREV